MSFFTRYCTSNNAAVLRTYVIAGLIITIGFCQFARAIGSENTQSFPNIATEKTPAIRVGVFRDGWPPYDKLDANNHLQGISANYLELILRTLNLQSTLVIYDNWGETLSAAKRGEVDLLVSIAITPERAKFLRFTMPYLRGESLLYTRKDEQNIHRIQDIRGRRIAIEENYPLQELLQSTIGEINFSVVKNTEQSLSLLASGKVDAYVGDLIASSYFIHKKNLINIEVRDKSGFDTGDIRFAVRKDWPELADAINSVLRTISEQQHQKIRQEWIPPLTEFNWSKILHLAAPFAAAILLALIGLLIWNGTLHRQIRQRRLLQNDLITSQRALREAKLEAEQQAENKARFLANMSHEIRTQMNAIIGLTQLVLKTPLNFEQTEYLDTIAQSGDSLLRILNDILDLSKIESGQLSTENIAFSPRQLLSNVEAIVAHDGNNRGINLVFQCSPDVPEQLWGDPHRIRQILINLSSNSIKFTRHGKVTVEMCTQSKSAKETILVLRVTDTGIGMTAEQCRHLFNPYTQASDDIARRFGGSGLGLAICKNLATLLGGDIKVASKVGKGSTFTVEIPLEKPKNDQAHDYHNESDKEFSFENMSVLVVDDNAVNRIIAGKFLETLGATVILASDGEEAVITAAKHHPEFDIIFMDIEMPGIDGMEATREIRQIPRYQKTPIIAMSAHVMKEHIEQSAAAGMNGHIAKPLELDKLQQILRTYSRPHGVNAN